MLVEIKQPLISIITISFNSKGFIEKTIQSVLNLNYRNMEYVFVDGLSTDGTLRIIESYFPKFKELGILYKYISEADSGIYHAMNKGLKLSTGDSVIFMNAGDSFYDDFDLQDLISSTDLYHNVVIGYSIQFHESDYYLRPNPRHEQNMIRYPAHQSTFIPRTYYSVNFFDEQYKIAGDYFWMKKILESAPHNLYKKVVSIFELGGKSSSSKLKDIIQLHKETNEGFIWVKIGLKFLIFQLLGKRLTFKLMYSKKYLKIPQPRVI